MSQQDCFYCTPSEAGDLLMYKAFELSSTIIYIFREQTYKGRAIVAHKKHVSEFVDLTDEEVAIYFQEMNKVAKAIHKAFNPAKINYAAYADTMCHLHFHLVPKYEGGADFGKPFASHPELKFNDDECKEIADQIFACLE